MYYGIMAKKYKALIEVEFEAWDDIRAVHEAKLLSNIAYKGNGNVYSIAHAQDDYFFKG